MSRLIQNSRVPTQPDDFVVDSATPRAKPPGGLRCVMSWEKERDSLIAQTMAFVQSVTARREEAGRLDTAVAPRAVPVLPILDELDPGPAPTALSPLEPVKVAELPLSLPPGKPAPAPRPI